MQPVSCGTCKKEITEKDVRVCPECGSMVCSDCYQSNGGVCEKCLADMTYLQ